MQRFGAEEFQILNKVEGFKDAREEAYKEKEMEKVSQFPNVNFMLPGNWGVCDRMACMGGSHLSYKTGKS